MSAEEPVALYGPDGRPTGESAPRWVVERDRLWHAATYIVVRDLQGRVYVHRRTAQKKLYPNAYDFACGGVLDFGETPYDGAVREAHEELGVTGVELRNLGEADFEGPADDVGPIDRVHGYLYECTYDGPIAWQPEEVAWGAWMTVGELRELLQAEDFVPDTPALLWNHVVADERPRQV